MSKTLFIADLHYGHNNIHEKFRTQFSSEQEHSEVIHQNIMSESGKRNNLWILGDIVFKNDYFHYIKDYCDHFSQVHLVLGNHDHKELPKFASDHGAYVHGLVQKYNLWLSHCPVHPQEMYRCKANVHGHLHTGKAYTFDRYEDEMVEDPQYLCVSCEQVDYKPISLESIREIFRSRGL